MSPDQPREGLTVEGVPTLGRLTLGGMAELSLSEVAALAIEAHCDQVDKAGVPYREHLRAVAGGLAFGPRLQMAGWLHDIIEDTSWTAAELRRAGVPPRVVQVVELVTRPEGADYLDVIRRITKDSEATLVKIADNAHNSHPQRAGPALPVATALRLADRYRRAREILWPAATPENITAILGRVNPALLSELA